MLLPQVCFFKHRLNETSVLGCNPRWQKRIWATIHSQILPPASINNPTQFSQKKTWHRISKKMREILLGGKTNLNDSFKQQFNLPTERGRLRESVSWVRVSTYLQEIWNMSHNSKCLKCFGLEFKGCFSSKVGWYLWGGEKFQAKFDNLLCWQKNSSQPRVWQTTWNSRQSSNNFNCSSQNSGALLTNVF